MDPFGYYAEGIQQHLDDAFAPNKQGSSDEASTPQADQRTPKVEDISVKGAPGDAAVTADVAGDSTSGQVGCNGPAICMKDM